MKYTVINFLFHMTNEDVCITQICKLCSDI